MTEPTVPANERDAILEWRDFSVLFSGAAGAVAVDQVNLDVRRGETVALVGESGSGKSVMALATLNLLPDTAIPSGSIRFEQQEMVGATPAELGHVRGQGVGFIFQEPMTSLNPLHTVGRQISEAVTLHEPLTRSAARARTIELLKQVQLPDAENRYQAYAHQLSGGQRQRAMIALALANRPKLLIADEPTTALDVTVEVEILRLLKRLQLERDMAMLFITHDLNIVRRIADRVAVMQAGRLVEVGNVEQIFDSPQHPYTRELLSAEPSGQPAPVAADAQVVLSGEQTRVWFPIRRGLLRRTVGHIKAVDGISLSVRQGETIGVVGESGSGKTTLALALLRLVSSTGPIVFSGRNIDGLGGRAMRPLRRQLQVVFQDPYGSLSPRMSVAEIVGEGLEVHDAQAERSERRRRVAEVLTEVGIEESSIDRYPHEFSGGQRQRIAIARALILRPALIILDEPTSALDRTVQAQVVELLRDLQRQYGLAYIFVSHDLSVVRAIAHQVVVMREGKQVEAGAAEEVLSAPKTEYAKALIAAAWGRGRIEV